MPKKRQKKDSSAEDEQRKLDRKYEQLSENDFFIEAEEEELGHIAEFNIVNVGMDQYYRSTADDVAVGTTGLNACMAICIKGINNDGVEQKVIAHISSLQSNLEAIFANLCESFNKESIETYIIGGTADSAFMQNPILRLAKKFKIVGVFFNPLDLEEGDDSDDSINIVFTGDGIYWGPDVWFREDSSKQSLDLEVALN